MCDSFRNETEYQFMTGGQWVAHPGNDGVDYTVASPTRPLHHAGIAPDFTVASEQYYMHVDPAIKTLADTRFPVADGPHVGNGEFDMPVIWTKYYGQGRVSYNSLGHHADIVAQTEVLPLMVRAALWAAHAEDAAERQAYAPDHDERLRRALVSLEGLSVGDAFGEQFFHSPFCDPAFANDYALMMRSSNGAARSPWRFTDDTQMALSSYSILRQYGGINQDILALTSVRAMTRRRGYGPAMHWLLPRLSGMSAQWDD